MFQPYSLAGIAVSQPLPTGSAPRPAAMGDAGLGDAGLGEAGLGDAGLGLGFVIGLLLEDAGIAITLPPTRPRGRKAGAHARTGVGALFPDARAVAYVRSSRADVAAFFARRRTAALTVDARAGVDAELAPLASSLLAALPHDALTAGLYADAIGALLAARCAGAPSPSPAGTRRPCGRLPKWRLKRVVDYVAAHLDEPITLADMSAAAKLTRMHFAAQFRAATGLRPHDYLLQQRIARAKVLLEEDLPIVQVALAVGFQTQAHFTTVFGRLVGETPSRWRQAHRAEQRPSREARALSARNLERAAMTGGVALA